MCTYIYLRCHGVCMKNHRLSRQGTRTTVWMCYAQFSLIRLVKYMQCSKCMYVWHYASAQDNKQWQHFNLSDLQWREWVMICFVYVCVFLYLQCVCVCVCVSVYVCVCVSKSALCAMCVFVSPVRVCVWLRACVSACMNVCVFLNLQANHKLTSCVDKYISWTIKNEMD